MKLKTAGIAATGLLGVGLALGLWVRTTFGPAPAAEVRASHPVAAAPSMDPRPASPTASGSMDAAGEAIAALLLAGTQTEGADAGAVFMVGGELQRVALGRPLGQSGWVLRRVGPRSAWLSQGADGPVHEIALRAPSELAPLRDEARQVGSVPSALTGKALPDSRLVVQRDTGGAALPEEMKVSVRRREAHRPGPVGEP